MDQLHPGTIVTVRYARSRARPRRAAGVILPGGLLWYCDNTAGPVAVPLPDPRGLVTVDGPLHADDPARGAQILHREWGTVIVLPDDLAGAPSEPYIFFAGGRWQARADLEQARAACVGPAR